MDHVHGEDLPVQRRPAQVARSSGHRFPALGRDQPRHDPSDQPVDPGAGVQDQPEHERPVLDFAGRGSRKRQQPVHRQRLRRSVVGRDAPRTGFGGDKTGSNRFSRLAGRRCDHGVVPSFRQRYYLF